MLQLVTIQHLPIHSPKESKIAVAHLSSSSKPKNKQAYGRYKDEPLLCRFDAICVLLSRTNAWRVTNTQRKALFLITRSPYTLASVDTISNWIKSIIQLSSPSSKAKFFWHFLLKMRV
jgi:hypothetical protein